MPKWIVDDGPAGVPAFGDGRLDAAVFHRNCDPVLTVLERLLAEREGHVLEIGSGTGQHIVAFAKSLPRLIWWPSDPLPAHLTSIEAWRTHAGVANVMAPVGIDAAAPDWRLGEQGRPPARGLAAIVAVNVLHIAPWAVAQGMIAGAQRHLGDDGLLVIYGPFACDGAHTSDSNAAFDADLRAQHPEWGVRDTADVAALAAGHGLVFAEIVEMPSNNLTLVLRREPRARRSA